MRSQSLSMAVAALCLMLSTGARGQTTPPPALPPSAAPVITPPPAPPIVPIPAPPAAPVINVPASADPSAPPAAAPAQPSPPAQAAPRRPPPPQVVRLPVEPRPTFTPDTLDFTLRAAERYQAIVAAGGWPRVAGPLSPGSSGKPVGVLQTRLSSEGDFKGAPTDVFDPETTAAVKRFQARHALPQTGVVANATLAALNVSAEARLKQINAAVSRLQKSSFAFGQNYVVVNIPTAQVEAVENGVVRRRHVAVVGDREHPSPVVETRIAAVNFNPTWTVPTSIIKKEIIPKMQRDRGYITRAGLKLLDRNGDEVSPAAVDWSGNEALGYTVRQPEGVRNALGQIRIDMPNSLSVYMHDTPGKGVFTRNDRFLSHGCVRVNNVRDFATWLLANGNGSWEPAQTDEAISEGERKTVRLARPIPVAWIYLTAYAQPDGAVQFRQDVYGLDTTGGGAPSQPATASATPTGGLW